MANFPRRPWVSQPTIMMMMTTMVLLVGAAAVAAESSESETAVPRRCGSALLEFMEFLCAGTIYDPYESSVPKRAMLGQRFFPLVAPASERSGGDKSAAAGLGFVRPETANQLLGKRNSHQSGIVFECCYKGCTIAEAQNYCPS
ncbi:insulin-like isoform X1 [Amblyomma americanum]